MKKKTNDASVFLIYAGIVHAIGLALLLPMLITLPGPGGDAEPDAAAIDVEIIPGTPPTAKIEPDSEETAALPSAPDPVEDKAAVEPAGEAVANVSPEAEPESAAAEEAPDKAASPAKDAVKTKAAATKAAPAAARKPVAQRSRTAKPAVRRTAKTKTKIAPFNGALTGLFSPGAPAHNRR